MARYQTRLDGLGGLAGHDQRRMSEHVLDVQAFGRQEVVAREVAHRPLQVPVVGQVHHQGSAKPQLLEGGLRLLGLELAEREAIQDPEALFAGSQGKGRAQRAAANLLRRPVSVVAGFRPHRLPAAHPVRGSDRALAGASGTLLLPGFASAARNQRAVLDRHRAGAARDLLGLDALVEKVRVDLRSEDDVGEVDGSDLLLLKIVDVESRHDRSYDLISTSTPALRSSFIRASNVCWVGSRMSSKRLWVRISNCSRLFLSTCGERR